MVSALSDSPAPALRGTAPLRAAAQQMEALFLTEMLKSAGVGAAAGPFGGGAGEAQFASFLRREQAGLMAEAGGIGLAERLFEAMQARTDDAG